MSFRARSRASTAVAASPAPNETEQTELWRKTVAVISEANDTGQAKVKNLVQTVAQTLEQLPLLQEPDRDLNTVVEKLTDLDDTEAKIHKLQALYEDEADVRRSEAKILQQALETVALLMSHVQAANDGIPVQTMLKKRRRGVEDPLSGKTPKRGRSTVSLEEAAESAESSLNPHLPIILGSQIAFRLRRVKGGEEEWIQCEVTKVISEGVRFEVQDPEPDENNHMGQTYKAGIRDIIAIPISYDNSSLTPYPAGSLVLARYPETTTFYRAEVIGHRDGLCRLKFEGEEEENKETEVERRLVLPLLR